MTGHSDQGHPPENAAVEASAVALLHSINGTIPHDCAVNPLVGVTECAGCRVAAWCEADRRANDG